MTSAAGSATPAPALQVYTSASRPIAGERTFSPVTSSLLLGREEAVLVDAQFMEEDVDALGDMVEASGRRLTHIVITHGHADHYFGADRLAQRFAGAAVVAAASVVDYISAHMAGEMRTFGMMFSDGLVLPHRSPSPLDGDVIRLGEEALYVIDVGQGDIAQAPSSTRPHRGSWWRGTSSTTASTRCWGSADRRSGVDGLKASTPSSVSRRTSSSPGTRPRAHVTMNRSASSMVRVLTSRALPMQPRARPPRPRSSGR